VVPVVAKFGAYEILHELKSGGMGAVLLGRRKGPGTFEQLVAIKTIRPEYASTEAVRAMFLDEAKILGGINHPGIATVHDFGEEAGTLYMVMEYVAGISFRSAMDLNMPPGVAARAIAEACRGLHAAHEVRDIAGNLLNVVHRDISPDNLLLGFDGHVKVIDFGIALVKNRQSPVTEFGTVKGKPPYMSPEQVKNEGLDRRSDVFSLAVVLHELLTNELLFDGDSIYAIARKVEHMEIRPPSHVLGKQLSLGLDATVMKALDRDPERRTPSAAAFAEQLEQVIGSSGDETLEAWAERNLAGLRDQHRAWLADVVAGRDAPRPLGRATNSVTALGPLAFVDQLPAAAPATPMPHEPSPSPEASTHLEAATGDSLALPRRSLALPFLLGLFVLLGIGGAIWFLSRSSTPGVVDAAVAQLDAAPDTTLIVQAADAAAPDAEPDEPDASVPADAAKAVVRDAGRRVPPPPDAPVAAAPSDAAVAETGTGKLIVRHHSTRKSYLDVFLDGKPIGKTPILPFKTLPAGPHVVTLVAPATGEVLHRAEIVIVDGKTTTVVQPAPP
jgi:serine/threonine-protein kinase